MDNAVPSTPQATPPVLQTQQPTPPVNKPHSRRKLMVFGLIGVFLLLLAGGGTYIFSMQNNPKTPVPLQVSPTVVPTMTSDPTADWKTYTNEKYRFSLKYPKEWFFGKGKNQDCLGSHKAYIDFYCNNNTSEDPPNVGFKTTFFGVDEDVVPANLTQKDALKYERGRGALPLVDEEFLTINGIPAYRALRQAKTGMGGEAFAVMRTDVEYSYLRDNDLYRLWFEVDSNEPDSYTKQFDSVAQTFKFTDSDSAGDMANWKTYQRSTVGYTFKYPSSYRLTEEQSVVLSFNGPTQTLGTEVFDGVILTFSLPFGIGSKTLKTYVEEDLEKAKEHSEVVKQIAPITVNGLSGYTYTINGLGEFNNMYFQSPTTKEVVHIHILVVDPKGDTYQKTVDTILSTFKFTQ